MGSTAVPSQSAVEPAPPPAMLEQMRIRTRNEWVARHPKRKLPMAIPTSELWLHHTAGDVRWEGRKPKPSRATSWSAAIRAIQDYHMDTNGWSDIAYSFLIDPDGRVWEGRGAGVIGAHTAGRNSKSHGICVLGNYEAYPPTEQSLASLVDLVRVGGEEGWWTPTISGPHRAAPNAQTKCCGAHLIEKIPGINLALSSNGGTMVGSSGGNPSVAAWQSYLNGVGASLKVDGDFGTLTLAASKARDEWVVHLLTEAKAAGSSPDAKLGAATRAAIDEWAKGRG